MTKKATSTTKSQKAPIELDAEMIADLEATDGDDAVRGGAHTRTGIAGAERQAGTVTC